MRHSIVSAAVLATVVGLADPCAAQNFASLDAAAAAGTLNYQRAKAAMPRLSEVIFEKADANGDGLVSPKELPTLESLYRTLYLDR